MLIAIVICIVLLVVTNFIGLLDEYNNLWPLLSDGFMVTAGCLALLYFITNS